MDHKSKTIRPILISFSPKCELFIFAKHKILIITFFTSVQEPFPSVAEPKLHKPVVGKSLTLTCTPPKSYPSPSIFWGASRPEGKFSTIETDARKSMDYNGNY